MIEDETKNEINFIQARFSKEIGGINLEGKGFLFHTLSFFRKTILWNV